MKKVDKSWNKLEKPHIIFRSALELLSSEREVHHVVDPVNQETKHYSNSTKVVWPNRLIASRPAIAELDFPFTLKQDQIRAVEAWMESHCNGSIIYGSGTGKTEIAFECAKRAADSMRSDSTIRRHQFNVLLLVPRIVLVEQNYDRLVKYGIDSSRIGKYFGDEKQLREITISTYQSLSRNPEVAKSADMIIFDEMHLAHRTFDKISAASDWSGKFLLGLTATIDESDPKNAIILHHMPPVRKYLIKDAVLDKRLAKPVVFPIRVSLTDKEQLLYDQCSEKIRRISNRFRRYDAKEMMALMKQEGFPRWQARAWFLNVKKRKALLASTDNKVAAAVDLIASKHRLQKVMVFSETLDSVRKLRLELKLRGIRSALIDSRTPSWRRKNLLSKWGSEFYVLLSVHTLEIGYDVPEAGVEIILATTSNMNQIVQRIGRVLRKIDGKDSALVYLIYVSDTKDNRMLDLVRFAVETNDGST